MEVKELTEKMSGHDMVSFHQWQNKQVDLEEFKSRQKEFRIKTFREYENLFDKVGDVAKSILKKIINKKAKR
jgi:hypothetical protein